MACFTDRLIQAPSEAQEQIPSLREAGLIVSDGRTPVMQHSGRLPRGIRSKKHFSGTDWQVVEGLTF